jgi:hypothetical protein
MFNVQRVRSVALRALAGLALLATNVVAAGAAGLPQTPKCRPLTAFDSKNFAGSIKIDNKFYPLIPGMQFILDGTIVAGGASTPTDHRVVFTVTDLTKMVNGVRTRVLWDTDTNGGELVESELAFQAQDNVGNVWVMGEYPEEYDAGVFVGADNTWISGIQRAQAGVLVPGHPKVGTDPFRQGYSPKIDFFDCGQVSAMDQTISGANKSYKDVLVINEWAPLEPTGGIQQKYYAPGVGVVQIGAVDDPEAETMVLTKIVYLSPRALANARNEALKLDRHGRDVSDIYRRTAPLELLRLDWRGAGNSGPIIVPVLPKLELPFDGSGAPSGGGAAVVPPSHDVRPPDDLPLPDVKSPFPYLPSE